MDDPIRNDLDAIAVGSFAFLRLEQRLHLADVSASGRERIDLP